MSAVLAVLRPEHRHLLDPDVCGGRAPRRLAPWQPVKRAITPGPSVPPHVWQCPGCSGSIARAWSAAWSAEEAVERIEHDAWCRLYALVLHDSRSPVVGRRGLACLADAAAERLGWDPKECSPSWGWTYRNCRRDGVVLMRCPDIRKSWPIQTAPIPTLLAEAVAIICRDDPRIALVERVETIDGP